MRPQYSFLVTLPPPEAMISVRAAGQFFDLLGGNVLPRQIDMLVEGHEAPFLRAFKLVHRLARSLLEAGKGVKAVLLKSGNTGGRQT